MSTRPWFGDDAIVVADVAGVADVDVAAAAAVDDAAAVDATGQSSTTDLGQEGVAMVADTSVAAYRRHRGAFGDADDGTRVAADGVRRQPRPQHPR